MNKYFRIIAAIGIMAFASSCVFDSEPKKPDGSELPKANTFTDFQHIGGRVNGVWTKANNPHIITGFPAMYAGDSLIIMEGVTLEGGENISAHEGTYLEIRGTAAEPVLLGLRPALHNFGGGVLINGKAKLSHFIDQGGVIFGQMDSAASLEIDHATFVHASNVFHFLDPTPTIQDPNKAFQVVPVTIRNSIFVAPIDQFGSNSPVALYVKSGVADTALWTVSNNCFYLPNYYENSFENIFSFGTLQGDFTAKTWPGNGNIAANPLFNKYIIYYKDTVNYNRSLSEPITDVYDLHLQPTSPCKGMGAYEE